MLIGESAVLVIGAGPAGAAAANVLARAGVDVAMLDRARFPRDKTCGDAVSNNGLRLLAELGALDAIKREPYAEVRRGIARFPDGSSIARDYGEPGFIVARLTLDDAIRRAAIDAGAHMHEGAFVRELVVENGAVVGVRGDAIDWRAKLVIAADGYGSLAWPHVGAQPKLGRGLAISTTGYYRNMRFPGGATDADHYFEADLPCGYGWIFPEVAGVANAGVYLRRDAYAPSASARCGRGACRSRPPPSPPARRACCSQATPAASSIPYRVRGSGRRCTPACSPRRSPATRSAVAR